MIDQEQTSALLMLIADMRLQIARLHAENAMLRSELAQGKQRGEQPVPDAASPSTVGDASQGPRGH